jgi:hypothetical protein
MPTLADGRNAIDQGNLQQARLIFEAILQENPRSEEAWLGLAEVLTETEDKRICLENVLKINKNNRAAREALRSLEPQADPLVDALRIKTTPPEESPPDWVSDMDATQVADRPPTAVETESEGGPSTPVLVAIGLALSVVVMALGGGLIFLILTNFTGG